MSDYHFNQVYTCLGVEEHGGVEAGGHGGMELWPNPASGVIHGRLSMDDGRFNRELTLFIYDIFGREVLSLPLLGGRAGDGGKGRAGDGGRQWQINVESYPSGVYIAILKNGFDLAGSKKFVVAR